MTQTSQPKKPFSDHFGRAMTLYADHFPILLNLSFFCAVPTLLKALFDRSEDPGISLIGLLLSPMVLMVYIFFWMCLVHAVSFLAVGKAVTIKESIVHVRTVFWRGLGGYLLFTVAVLAGLLCLIIPGIWLLAAFYFFIFAIVIEGRTVRDSFSRSRDLVLLSFWRVVGAHGMVFLLTLLLTLPIIVGMKMMGMGDSLAMVVAGVAMMVIMPVFTLFYYFIYVELKDQKDGVMKISVHS